MNYSYRQEEFKNSAEYEPSIHFIVTAKLSFRNIIWNFTLLRISRQEKENNKIPDN
jgi:hypothetical protein